MVFPQNYIAFHQLNRVFAGTNLFLPKLYSFSEKQSGFSSKQSGFRVEQDGSPVIQ
jgi:hypothetical protein